MPINLSAYDELTSKAVKHFWRSRRQAAARQKRRGATDQGNRAGVTAGKNMDGFIKMVRSVVETNGIAKTNVYFKSKFNRVLPGYFRATKEWDLLVVKENELLAAIEFKSQVGPSFGNNFNNRVEEAIGNAVDFATAFREGAFGESMKPFLGYFFVLEECSNSMEPVRSNSPHFSLMPGFDGSSYAARYDILCRKLVQEQLYDAAALMLTSREDEQTGNFRSFSSK